MPLPLPGTCPPDSAAPQVSYDPHCTWGLPGVLYNGWLVLSEKRAPGPLGLLLQRHTHSGVLS